jgi:hypothetical protein
MALVLHPFPQEGLLSARVKAIPLSVAGKRTEADSAGERNPLYNRWVLLYRRPGR